MLVCIFQRNLDRSFTVRRRVELTGRPNLFEQIIQGDLVCQERGYLCEKYLKYYDSNIPVTAVSV